MLDRNFIKSLLLERLHSELPTVRLLQCECDPSSSLIYARCRTSVGVAAVESDGDSESAIVNELVNSLKAFLAWQSSQNVAVPAVGPR